MARPNPTKSARKIKSDLLVVRPYAIGIVTMGVAALFGIVVTVALAESITSAGIICGSITMFTTQVIGYLLILAKQVESDHRVNSRMDELLESSGRVEYDAGKRNGVTEHLENVANGVNRESP